ncbi:uroporphyrinogen decarboxylase family protein [Clostridium sediminicola]|uniref:uroporphyrinogen decarboxylase family protein n=1 Tax=Clostridium sediminicola TaxID=3114879 RepID=UPI0031F226DB
MLSRERVRKAIMHKQPDRVPTNFECVDSVMEKLLKHYSFNNAEQVYQKFEIDIRSISPIYCGPELKSYTDIDGNKVQENFLGFSRTHIWTGKEYNHITTSFPMDSFQTVEDIDNYKWPSPDWFDYESIKYQCEQHKDKAIIVGHEGPFQIVTNLRRMENLFMDMILNPQFAKRLFDRMVEFELEYYERILIAGDGKIDIIRPHDDYGTQIGLLFSVDIWRKYMKENTRKLVDLAHKYGAFYQQHSCGAIREIIPELVDCGVDILEPIQKVKGMEPEKLKKDFGHELAFQGGIDTQKILPKGSVKDVINETNHFIDTFNVEGGYILMGSQSFEGDIPIENIEAIYSVSRI